MSEAQELYEHVIKQTDIFDPVEALDSLLTSYEEKYTTKNIENKYSKNLGLNKNDIFKDGFYKHILDRKRPYWAEKGEGEKLYDFIKENSKLIDTKREKVDRGNPKKDSSFVTVNFYETYQYNDLYIKIEMKEARSGNKRYTINVVKG